MGPCQPVRPLVAAVEGHRFDPFDTAAKTRMAVRPSAVERADAQRLRVRRNVEEFKVWEFAQQEWTNIGGLSEAESF